MYDHNPDVCILRSVVVVGEKWERKWIRHPFRFDIRTLIHEYVSKWNVCVLCTNSKEVKKNIIKVIFSLRPFKKAYGKNVSEKKFPFYLYECGCILRLKMSYLSSEPEQIPTIFLHRLPAISSLVPWTSEPRGVLVSNVF